MVTIHTDRLILRNVKRSDLNDMHEYMRDKDVGPHSGWEPHESRARTRFVLKVHYLNNPFAFGIFYEGKMIGSVSMDVDRKRLNERIMSLGYSMSSKHWGKGIMTEAVFALLSYMFENYEIDAVSANCFPHNLRSKRVLEKVGFEYEGTLKQCQVRYDGKVLDHMCYLLTKERFNAVLLANNL